METKTHSPSFTVSLRGYDREEVDQYIDTLAEALEQVDDSAEHNRRLQSHINRLNARIKDLEDRINSEAPRTGVVVGERIGVLLARKPRRPRPRPSLEPRRIAGRDHRLMPRLGHEEAEGAAAQRLIRAGGGAGSSNRVRGAQPRRPRSSTEAEARASSPHPPDRAVGRTGDLPHPRRGGPAATSSSTMPRMRPPPSYGRSQISAPSRPAP
jgi:DivIVA domain-containing protein